MRKFLVAFAVILIAVSVSGESVADQGIRLSLIRWVMFCTIGDESTKFELSKMVIDENGGIRAKMAVTNEQAFPKEMYITPGSSCVTFDSNEFHSKRK